MTSFNAGSAIFTISLDQAAYENSLRSAERATTTVAQGISQRLDSVGRSLIRFGSVIGQSIGGAIEGLSRRSIEAVSRAQQIDSAFSAVLGNAAVAARGFSEAMASGLGLDPVRVREFQTQFFGINQIMGFTERQSLQMAEAVTRLTFDFAAFRNLKAEDAFDKIRAGLLGVSRPLQQMGVLVDDNRVKAFAYREGIAQVDAELTEQQKVLGRLGLMMEQLRPAQGALLRDSDSWEVAQIRLSAATEKLNRSIGAALLPTMLGMSNAATGVASGLADVITKLDATIPGLGSVVAIMAVGVSLAPRLLNALGFSIIGIAQLITILPKAAALWAAFWTAATGPIGLMIIAISALLVGIGILGFKLLATSREAEKAAKATAGAQEPTPRPDFFALNRSLGIEVGTAVLGTARSDVSLAGLAGSLSDAGRGPSPEASLVQVPGKIEETNAILRAILKQGEMQQAQPMVLG